MQHIDAALAFPPEVERNYLLQKTPCIQTQGPEASELELIWMPLPRGLASMVPNDAMQASKAEKLPSYDAYEPQKQPAWYDNPGFSNAIHTLMGTSSLVDLKRETVWY